MKDYATSGMDIQSAMIDQARQFKKKEKPPFLLWGGRTIKTSDAITAPRRGVVILTFLSGETSIEQGFDLKLNKGFLQLSQDERVSLLRTWRDLRFEDRIEYPFCSDDEIIWFWNVYKRKWPDGSVTEEKWTGNAGFWVEEMPENRRIYHCSHGFLSEPNFESLVVEVSIQDS
jgi:hypothetical protein